MNPSYKKIGTAYGRCPYFHGEGGVRSILRKAIFKDDEDRANFLDTIQ